MSHQPERKEKNCLNCGTEVVGRFCHVCGQENIVTHQNFWSLATHFVYDILHFDGKFFHTLGYLFSRPGFVAQQYVEGKRKAYLDPIRMYLFTSAIFFLIFFSFNKVNFNNQQDSGWLTNEDRRELAAEYKERIQRKQRDSLLRDRIPILLDTTKPLNIDSMGWREKVLVIGDRDYASVKEYDSLQATLPSAERHGWLKRLLVHQAIKINVKYADSGEKAAEILIEGFFHRLPTLLFVLLPFFALVLKLLYLRRKQFYYSDHAVFTLYHYIFSFLLLLLLFGMNALRNWTEWGVFKFITLTLPVVWLVYLYIEMKRFYGQNHFKTAVKFMLLNAAGLFILILLFFIFFLFSIFQL